VAQGFLQFGHFEKGQGWAAEGYEFEPQLRHGVLLFSLRLA
jgi:hypothetical protein